MEVDWLSSMQQSFSFYKVDPKTWSDSEKMETIKSCEITRDREDETFSYASVQVENLEGEYYVRVYMDILQNQIKFREIMGTFLLQVNSSDFDGKVTSISIDAYSPLIELKEKYPPIGYSLKKGDIIMDNAIRLSKENMRAPILQQSLSSKVIENDSGFVAGMDENWLSYLTDLSANADFEYYVEPNGTVLFSPKQDVSSLKPVWTYDDNNSSILYPDITVDRDLYGIPNVVEVIYSTANLHYIATAKNEDPNSPVSIPSRGREIVYRVTEPDAKAIGTKDELDNYAKKILRELSTVEYSVSYVHGYCPVRVSDCVLLNYSRAGLQNVKAKVVRQSIKCETGCSVSEKAVFTTNLWG